MNKLKTTIEKRGGKLGHGLYSIYHVLGQLSRRPMPFHKMYPENLAGIPDALIFFCFFSCIKARKEE